MSVMIRIPWHKTLPRTRKEPIRWTRANSKYEIYASALESIELESILAHCKVIKHKIKRVVSAATHVGPSFFEVFPRTLEQEMEDAWEPAVAALGPNPAQTEENFDQALKTFIAAHATGRDRHALVQQLSHPTKPKDMAVQAYHHRLLELNNAVELLPGTKPKLTDEQLKQALYDGMPQTWQKQFISGGNQYETMDMAELVAYFRELESIDRTDQQRNTPSKNKPKKRPGDELEGGKRFNKKQKGRFQKKEKKNKTKTDLQTITDDFLCPLHPNGTHTWGQCRSRQTEKTTRATGGNGGKGKDKGKQQAQNFALTHDHEATAVEASSGEEGTSFPTSSLVAQCDTHLTSTPLTFPTDVMSQDRDDVVFKAFSTAMEDSHAAGMDTGPLQGNEINVLHKTVRRNMLLPIGIMSVATIQGQAVQRPLKVLFESGSMVTLINPRVLPENTVSHKLKRSLSVYTVGGTVVLREGVILRTLRFPELSTTRSFVTPVEAITCPHTRDYDVILGTDVLTPVGLDVHTSTQTIRWGDLSVPWRTHDSFSERSFKLTVKDMLGRLVSESEVDSFSTQLGTKEILAAKYERADTIEVAKQQQHLTLEQQEQLSEVLQRYSTLFSGKLGCYPGRKVHLDYDTAAPPFHHRPYPIPHAHQQVFKDELERLVELGVLSKTGPSRFLSPTFIIPKKDGAFVSSVISDG